MSTHRPHCSGVASVPRSYLALVAAVAAGTPPAVVAEVLPAGFDVTTYASGLVEPVALDFAPDGRLFVAQRDGTLVVVEPIGGKDNFAAGGWPAHPPFAFVENYSDNENGLLGLALDPDFADNGFVYVYVTATNREARILRLTAPRADEISAAPQALEAVVLRDRLPTRGGFHSGGGLEIGPDRMLYFAIGDNLIEANAQEMNTLSGKISRINLDGSTPADNPFVTPTGSPRAIYALGLRNPFRFCFAPDGRLFASDVGSIGLGRREEINIIRRGDNCGWPLREGRLDRFAFGVDRPATLPLVDPALDYFDGGASPVGIVYYTGANFAPEYAGNVFFIDYVLNRMYRLELDGDAVLRSTLFVEGGGGMLDLVQGPDGCLYYCEFVAGRIQRLSQRRDADVTSSTDASTPADGPGPAPLPSAPAGPPISPCGVGALSAMMLIGVGLLGARRRNAWRRDTRCAGDTANMRAGARACPAGNAGGDAIRRGQSLECPGSVRWRNRAPASLARVRVPVRAAGGT